MPHRVFEEVVLPHLDAAFNYARWLTKSDADAEDVVQDAAVRALRFFSSLRNDDARAWLLTIVRNTWYARFSKVGRADRLDQRVASPAHRQHEPGYLAALDVARHHIAHAREPRFRESAAAHVLFPPHFSGQALFLSRSSIPDGVTRAPGGASSALRCGRRGQSGRCA